MMISIYPKLLYAEKAGKWWNMGGIEPRTQPKYPKILTDISGGRQIGAKLSQSRRGPKMAVAQLEATANV
jgi:hypothetical protein